MKIVFAPQAKLDLEQILDYLLHERPSSAQDILDRIKRQIVLLYDQPQLGRPGRVPGTRELILPDLPFSIPYQMSGSTLEILRAYHSARK